MNHIIKDLRIEKGRELLDVFQNDEDLNKKTSLTNWILYMV